MPSGDPYVTIGIRNPPEVDEAIVKDAARLGLTKSEYGRMALDRLMKAKVAKKDADPFRHPPTQAEKRAAARAAKAARTAATASAGADS